MYDVTGCLYGARKAKRGVPLVQLSVSHELLEFMPEYVGIEQILKEINPSKNSAAMVKITSELWTSESSFIIIMGLRPIILSMT